MQVAPFPFICHEAEPLDNNTRPAELLKYEDCYKSHLDL